MVKALVVYYSMFGNTMKLAEAVSEGLQSVGCHAKAVSVEGFDFEALADVDLLCVGTPVHAWNISKPVKVFLDSLAPLLGLVGKRGFAFDTKMKSRLAGTAGGKIQKKLEKLGFDIVEPARSAIVKGREGPLEEGSEEAFKQIGSEIGRKLLS